MATDSTTTEPKAASTTDETASAATEEEQRTDAAEAASQHDLGQDASAEEAHGDAPSDLDGTPVARRGGGIAAGAGALVSAGLGLCSLTGTSLGEMLRERKQLLGQIEAGSGGASDQVNALYGAPWHAAAMINCIFALIAVLLGGLLVLQLSGLR